jgi:hypothetical protein
VDGAQYRLPKLDSTTQAMRASLLAMVTINLLRGARAARLCTHWSNPPVG